MFEELIVQIKHQYGKYLNFDNAYTDAKEPVFGMSQGFFEDETIVRFIPKNGGYQIKHQYGKYLNFDNAYNKSKERVYGMSRGFYEDETIVHIIPKNGGYQIKHQYGKYLNFDNAYTSKKEPVYGMSQGFCEDETIVNFIPIKYKFVIKIEDFEYDTSNVYNAQLNGRIKNCSFINKTFHNNSNTNQQFDINERITYNNSITIEHSTTDVTRWLKTVSVGFKITTKGKVSLPLVTDQEGEASFDYDYSWGRETVNQFTSRTSKSVEKTVDVIDKITVSPGCKMTYKSVKKQLAGITVPYKAIMKISCEMDGNHLSDRALQFILNHVGNRPNGTFTTENGLGVYSTELTGKIIPDIALNFLTCCDEQPL